MKGCECKFDLIGKHLRLPNWESCTFLVEDCGTKYFFGRICDENKEAIVHEVRLIDEPWEEVE